MRYGSLEQLLAYPVPRATKPTTRVETGGGIEAFLQDKVRSVGGIVQDIELEIVKRRAVSHDVIQRVYHHYFYVKTKLLELYTWPLGRAPPVDQRRSKLETELDTLLHETREEKVRCTEHIASLKKELWHWLKEYLDMMLRVKLVTGFETRQQ